MVSKEKTLAPTTQKIGSRQFRNRNSKFGIAPAPALLLLSMILPSALAIGAGPQAVTTEPKQVLLPAGLTRKPFDVTRHVVPLSEIREGGPARDRIPALVYPTFLAAHKAAGILKDSDRVLGVFWNGVAKAYPVRILNWHELVNDELGGRPILVSWCPLCGSGLVYDPVIEGRRYDFGVSGKLYKRNLLFFDRQTDSLWSQLLCEAVTGPMAGTRLHILPAENTTWGAWKHTHRATLVLSFATGYQRNYEQDHYAGFPFPRRPALLVSNGEHIRIYPFSELSETRGKLAGQLGADSFRISFDRRAKVARVENQVTLTYFVGFLDDLEAFFPMAEVMHSRRQGKK